MCVLPGTFRRQVRRVSPSSSPPRGYRRVRPRTTAAAADTQWRLERCPPAERASFVARSYLFLVRIYETCTVLRRSRAVPPTRTRNNTLHTHTRARDPLARQRVPSVATRRRGLPVFIRALGRRSAFKNKTQRVPGGRAENTCAAGPNPPASGRRVGTLPSV